MYIIQFKRGKDKKKRKSRKRKVLEATGLALVGASLYAVNKNKKVSGSSPIPLLPGNKIRPDVVGQRTKKLRKVGFTNQQILQGKFDRLPTEMKVMLQMNNSLRNSNN